MGNNHWAFLKRNLKVANTEIKSRVYQSLVPPKLECSCSVWDPHAKDQHLTLEEKYTVGRLATYKTTMITPAAQYVVKSIATCKINPYIINQNNIVVNKLL